MQKDKQKKEQDQIKMADLNQELESEYKYRRKKGEVLLAYSINQHLKKLEKDQSRRPSTARPNWK